MSDSPVPGAGRAAARLPDRSAAGVQRQGRRLSDRILTVFHQSCDENELDVAASLLVILERMIVRRAPVPDALRRRDMESLVAAHERLWHLRNPQPA